MGWCVGRRALAGRTCRSVCVYPPCRDYPDRNAGSYPNGRCHCDRNAITDGHCDRNIHYIAHPPCDCLTDPTACPDRYSISDGECDRSSYDERHGDPHPIDVWIHCHAGHWSDHPNDFDTDGIRHAIACFETDGNRGRAGPAHFNPWCLTDTKCHCDPNASNRTRDFPFADPRGVCTGTAVRGYRLPRPVPWAICSRKPHASRRTQSCP